MKSEMWLRGRKAAEQAVRIVKRVDVQGIFMSVFFNPADYERTHELLKLTGYETWEDYREKVRGALSFLTDTDGVRFVDVAKCIDDGGLQVAHDAPGIGHQRLTLSV